MTNRPFGNTYEIVNQVQLDRRQAAKPHRVLRDAPILDVRRTSEPRRGLARAWRSVATLASGRAARPAPPFRPARPTPPTRPAVRCLASTARPGTMATRERA